MRAVRRDGTPCLNNCRTVVIVLGPRQTQKPLAELDQSERTTRTRLSASDRVVVCDGTLVKGQH
jgi:hypothetical protein